MKYFPIYQKFVPTRVNEHYLSPVASITRQRVKPGAFRNGLHALSWVTAVTRVYSELNRVNNFEAVIIVKYYSFLKRKQHYIHADLQSFRPLSRWAKILQLIIPLNVQNIASKNFRFSQNHVYEPYRFRGAHLARQKYNRVNQTTPQTPQSFAYTLQMRYDRY